MLDCLVISARIPICEVSAHKGAGRRNSGGEFARCSFLWEQNGQGTDCDREDVIGEVGAPAGASVAVDHGARGHAARGAAIVAACGGCLLYTSPSPRD